MYPNSSGFQNLKISNYSEDTYKFTEHNMYFLIGKNYYKIVTVDVSFTTHITEILYLKLNNKKFYVLDQVVVTRRIVPLRKFLKIKRRKIQ